MDAKIPVLLKKTASLLREQEQEKTALEKKLGDLEKEASVNRTVLNMLRGDLINATEIDSKIAEFNSNPELLKNAMNFYEKPAEIGETKGGLGALDEGKPEENFATNLIG